VGSTNGSAVMVSPSDLSYNVKNTVTPFGRAFYQGKAAYKVMPIWVIAFYNTLWQAFCTCFRNSPTALALIIASIVMKFEQFEYSAG
jgi:hypothetical protein